MPTLEELQEYIYAVHGTNRLPLDGKLIPGNMLENELMKNFSKRPDIGIYRY